MPLIIILFIIASLLIPVLPTYASPLSINPISQFDGSDKNKDCGPTCVAMIIKYYQRGFPSGISSNRMLIDQMRYFATGQNDKTQETSPEQLERAISNASSTYRLSINYRKIAVLSSPTDMIRELRYITNARHPVIALVHGTALGRSEEYKDHFIVIKGFSDNGQTVYVNDPDTTKVPKGETSLAYSVLLDIVDGAPGHWIEVLPDQDLNNNNMEYIIQSQSYTLASSNSETQQTQAALAIALTASNTNVYTGSSITLYATANSNTSPYDIVIRDQSMFNTVVAKRSACTSLTYTVTSSSAMTHSYIANIEDGYSNVKCSSSPVSVTWTQQSSTQQSSTSTKPGGMWVSPANGAKTTGNLYYAAQAYPTKPGDPAINHVNFTAWWPGLGPESGPWYIASTVYSPTYSYVYECNWDMSGVPAGPVKISFDVYDKDGNKNLAPNGVRSITYKPSSTSKSTISSTITSSSVSSSSTSTNTASSVSVPGTPTPTSPSNGSTRPQSSAVVFAWNPVAGASQYKVELWGGVYSLMTPVDWKNVTSFTIASMWPGGPYYWHVKAKNSSGESDWSPTVSFSVGAAASAASTTSSGPEQPSYAPSFAGQTVSWKGNSFRSDDGKTWIFQGSDAERAANAGTTPGSFKVLTPPSGVSFPINQIPSFEWEKTVDDKGQPVRYELKINGINDPQLEASKGAKRNLSYSTGTNNFFTPPQSDFREDLSYGWNVEAISSSNSRRVADQGDRNFTVLPAVSSTSASATSSTSSGLTTPPVPSNPQAVAIDSSHIQVSWTDTSGGKANFRIWDTQALNATVIPGITSYTFNNVTPSTHHCFHIQAFNSAGSSAWTSNACIDTSSNSETLAFREKMFQYYGFSSEAAQHIRSSSTIVMHDPPTEGGGFWWPGERKVELWGFSHEPAVHELSHAWWEDYRSQNRNLIIDLAKDVVRLADMDSGQNSDFAAAIQFAKGYVYGIGNWKGMYSTDNGNADVHNLQESDFSEGRARVMDWEIYAGFCSWTMGRFRDGSHKLPQFMWKYFEPEFTGQILVTPYYDGANSQPEPYTTQLNTQPTCSSTARPLVEKQVSFGPYNGTHKYALRIYNVDDVAKVTINDTQIGVVNYQADSGWLDISQHLQSGLNSIRLTVENSGGGWTYGFGLRQDGNTIWDDNCGNVSVRGCRNDDQSKGEVYRCTVSLTTYDNTSSTASTKATAPAAPSNIQLTVPDTTHLKVTWIDNSGGQASFNISDAGALNATVNPGTTSYTFSNVTPGSYHCFHIQAFNSAGSSTWTDYACVTTPSVQAPSNLQDGNCISFSSSSVQDQVIEFNSLIPAHNPDINSAGYKMMNQLFQCLSYEKKLILLKELSSDNYYPTAASHILMNLDASTRNKLITDLANSDALAASRVISHAAGVNAPEIYQMFNAILNNNSTTAYSVLAALDADPVRKYYADAIRGYFKL